jgi:hypothetical protein
LRGLPGRSPGPYVQRAESGKSQLQIEARAMEEFPCKRMGCTEVVRYERVEVPGALRKSSEAKLSRRNVYLRCADGHVHVYSVGSDDEG